MLKAQDNVFPPLLSVGKFEEKSVCDWYVRPSLKKSSHWTNEEVLDSALIQEIDSAEDIADDAPGQVACKTVAIQPHPQQNIRNEGLLELQ